MKVHLLATVRKEELLPATTMVFKTLRVGFPKASVIVHLNRWEKNSTWDTVMRECNSSDVSHTKQVDTIHHDWINHLLKIEDEPFWICDTDMIFWKPVEDRTFGDAPMAGRFVPQFFDKFTNCITRSRLHTSLLYLNPVKIREATEKYFAQFVDTPFNPRPNLINPMFHPVRDGDVVRNYFNDTCSLLYHAIGGQKFTNDQLDHYDHLGFGTISDLVAPHYPGFDLRMKAFVVFDNPQLLKGQWQVEDRFYAENAA